MAASGSGAPKEPREEGPAAPAAAAATVAAAAAAAGDVAGSDDAANRAGDASARATLDIAALRASF